MAGHVHELSWWVRLVGMDGWWIKLVWFVGRLRLG
jgi:hypothetical protein